MAVATAGSSAKLTDVFSDLFVLGVSLREARDVGTVEALRTRLLTLVHSAETQGKEQGFTPEVLAHAKYAVAAFLDEMIASSNWTAKERWSSRPLQFELFEEYVAGEGFFRRLEALRGALPINTDLIEVYVHCLILGFEGQYKLEDRGKLRGLIDDVTREIQAKREVLPLAPHGPRPQEVLEMVKRGLPVWVVLVLSVGIVVFFYVGLSLLMRYDAGQVVEELQRLLQDTKQ